ncbi:hypothetical protein HNP36_002094 [Chryseobacterium shigense]|uniref:Uncharacterized protein n=1 Tax=Chryseobacterium shigense TaxID=297244 RepID=A0A841NBD9_9FLAO|nr:hypothetical protein [Chryseobacterium shigense]
MEDLKKSSIFCLESFYLRLVRIILTYIKIKKFIFSLTS